MQIHLDLLGGWSGDMFVAALLDAFPDFWPRVQASVAVLGLGDQAACRLTAHHDGTLAGRRFLVAADAQQGAVAHAAGPAHGRQGHLHHHHDGDHHVHGHQAHRAWADIREHLEGSALDPSVKRHAIDIFALLADAEAAVHGVGVDTVAFHEVGATDSIVDIVAAAQLIVLVDATRWTASPFPLGSGRIRSSHGWLPVPAPATTLLLRGFPTIDDGIEGERVTPTGAAVARHLLDPAPVPSGQPRRLVATGIGFGQRTRPGISNGLRVLAFEDMTVGLSACKLDGVLHRGLGIICFEADDQSPEDLAMGLDHIRAMPGVFDVTQSAAFGKKGRMAMHVQVLVSPERLDAAVAACFVETATIGLRYQVVHGALLDRAQSRVAVGASAMGVKTVNRPGGMRTAKAEAADVEHRPGFATRAALRHAGEAAALASADHFFGPETE